LAEDLPEPLPIRQVRIKITCPPGISTFVDKSPWDTYII